MSLGIYLPLDSEFGLTDLSGNGRTATAQGGLTVGGAAGALAGDQDMGATDFDGANDYISTNYTTRRNYCPNPSFETNTTGWLMGWGGGSGLTLTRTSDWARTGAWSCRCQATGGGAAYVGAYHANITISAGSTHTVSARVRSRNGGTYSMLVYLSGGSGDQATAGASVVLAAGEEATISHTITSINGNTLLIPIPRAEGTPATIDFDLDAVLVERAATVGNYFDGSGYFNSAGVWVSDPGGHSGWLGTAHATQSDKGVFANGTTRTFTGWARKDGAALDLDSVFGNVNTHGGYSLLRFGDGSNKVSFWSDASAGGVTWTGVIPASGWFHWALVFDEVANNATLYIDGISQGTVSQTVQYAGGQDLALGAHSANTWPWDGQMAHFTVFERGLTADEILRLYRAGTRFS